MASKKIRVGGIGANIHWGRIGYRSRSMLLRIPQNPILSPMIQLFFA